MHVFFCFIGIFIIEDSYEEIHKDKFETCPVCERKITITKIEIHHCLPKSKGGTPQKSMRLCATCHDIVHYVIPINDIVKYNTADKIKNVESMQKYLAWIRTKKGSFYKIKKIRKFI